MNFWKLPVFLAFVNLAFTGCYQVSGQAGPFAGGMMFGASTFSTGSGGNLKISEDVARDVGQRIWQNESAGTIEGLTAWNKGENFASLGIGHFIWYPAGEEKVFTESFPDLLRFLMARGVAVPGWLRNVPPNPWPTREAFYAEINSPRMMELRQFLANTVPEQARFVAQRLEQSLPKMREAAPPQAREDIQRRFYALAETPKGLYAMIDYVNFKGEGINPKERYKGHGWGLLQVLMAMQDPPTSNHFADAAARVLLQRIANSPPERGESRWRAGWLNRTNTYR